MHLAHNAAAISRKKPRNPVTSYSPADAQSRFVSADIDSVMHEMKGLRRAAMRPSRWAGARMLQTAHRLNERCFSLLAETVRTEGAGIEPHAIYGLHELWVQVDARVCERAGRCPVLLLDLNFQSADWWRRVCHGDGSASGVKGPSALFTVEHATPLLREILVEAWSIGRSMRHTSSLIF